jgi:hypothetical protein
MTFERTIADLLGRGIGVRFRAAGGSMHPTIRCGQHLEVMPVDAAALACGDVVLTRQRRGLTAHRIVRIHQNRITTRGDSCSENDPELCAADILGRVVGIPSRSRARARHWVRRALTVFSRLR